MTDDATAAAAVENLVAAKSGGLRDCAHCRGRRYFELADFRQVPCPVCTLANRAPVPAVPAELEE